jgi:hypothetical protein
MLLGYWMLLNDTGDWDTNQELKNERERERESERE